MKSFFIAGTDTGVGKTVLSATLLASARAQDIDAVYMKPVQTGCTRRGSQLVAPDLECCLRAAGLRPLKTELASMCPYRFIPACSPHLAAARARRPIRIDRIVTHFRRLQAAHKAVIVEGAGGVLAPLGPRTSMLDLMKALALPVVVAARPGLGTINHTLLTLHELRRAQLTILGVFFVHTTPNRNPAIERDNERTIARTAEVPILGRIPFSKDLSSIASAKEDWKNPSQFFQPLERTAQDFPRVGK